MQSVLIKNARIVDANTDVVSDLFVVNGKISEMGKKLDKSADEVVDASGKILMPGLFDMHVHFREPGFEYKETVKTGCNAAIYGGVTGVACMPNTKPVTDSKEIIEHIINESKGTGVKVYPIASTTCGMKGEKLSDYAELKKAGAIAVSDDGRPVENFKVMREALKKAEANDMLIISHCEDLAIIDGGIMNEGKISRKLGVKGMDRLSENMITIREMLLAYETNTRIHIAHVSTKECVDAIRFAKSKGVKVTCETAPHYFMLTDEKLLARDADFRMNPPLREKADVQAILEGIEDGTIDAIVTDHAPHAAEEKKDFETAPNGVVGLETSLAATLTALYHTGKCDLKKICRLMSDTPRRLLGIEPLNICPGNKAEFILVDPDEEWMVEPEKLHSKSHNTVFKGMTLKGKVKYVYSDNTLRNLSL